MLNTCKKAYQLYSAKTADADGVYHFQILQLSFS